MIERARFEIMPFARGEEEAAALPEPVRLTVTSSPKHELDHTVQIAARLRALGHGVTVHMAARLVRDRMHLDALLSALVEADIDDIFLIGGDVPSPLGLYPSARELLPLLHEHPHRPRTIGIAGYPEGHPKIDAHTLSAALEEKSRRADYLTTQLCFNPQAVVTWIHEIRQAAITLPVIVGLPGLVDRRKLLEISVRVGVGASLAFLRQQSALNLLRWSASSVERLYEALAPSLDDPALGLAGFHYFTFNQLVDTWRWAQAHSGRSPIQTQKEMTLQ